MPGSSIVPSLFTPFRAPSALVLQVLVGCGACTGDPSGPDGAPDEPTGRIFFEWIPPGESRPQPWVYDFTAREALRVPIWFDQGAHPHVDTAGTSIVFDGPGFDLAIVSLFDTTDIEIWSDFTFNRKYPRLSQDGRFLAMTREIPGVGEVVDHIDRATQQVLEMARFESQSGLKVIHWFAGADSLLVRVLLGSGTTRYAVARFGGEANPFSLAPAEGAQSLAITNDGSRIALCAPPPPDRPMEERDTRRVEVYDLTRRILIREFVLPHWCGEMAWSPDGRFLAHAPAVLPGRESLLEILDVATGLQTSVIPVVSGASYAASLTWVRATVTVITPETTARVTAWMVPVFAERPPST